MDERRTREEELEYRRYIYRLKKREERRRKVMVARAIVAVACALFVVLFGGLIRWGVQTIVSSQYKSKKADKKVEASSEPTLKPLDYSVPEGFEEISQALEALREDYPEVEDILMNLYEYPEDLLNLVVKNQETLEFVLEYPRHKSDIRAGGTITKEELKQGIPALQQWDTRWGYLTYGSDIIAINGCGPTCLSMVVSGLLQDTSKTPDAMAEFSVENNYYTAASGSAWALMSTGAEKQGVKAETVVISEDAFTAQLKNNHPMICSMMPGDFTTTGHFIVLTGLTEDGKVTLNDPNSIANSEKEWDMETLIGQVKAAWAYSA